MAKAKRVFEIAKEIGVPSKEIVAKCKAEGVPDITNHMSTVKLGLVQTIHEWFGGGLATAVETAPEVKPKKVKAKAPAQAEETAEAAEAQAPEEAQVEETPQEAESAVTLGKAKAKKKAAEEAEAEAAEAEQAALAEVEAKEAKEEQAPAEIQAKAEAQAPAQASDETQAAQPQAQAEAQAPASEAQAEETPEQQETEEEAVQARGQVNVPSRPDVVKPAGEMLTKPQGVALKGPRVVRVEQPDAVPEPRRRRPGGPGGSGGPSGPSGPGGGRGDEGVPGITRSRGPARGRGAGGGAPAPEQRRPGKRRSQSIRRGRQADGLKQQVRGNMSPQDLLELDARLKGAPGYLKQRRRAMKDRSGGGHQAQPAVEVGGQVEIAEPVTIKSFSAATGIKSADIIKWLFGRGIMATINSAIDSELAQEVALEYNIELVVKEQQTAEQQVVAEFESREKQDERRRPPVVTVLGHVDHGKTSLLDKIRQEDVAAHEAGGITQHIGAYRVTIKGTDEEDKTVVFLDTPGHEAFTSMRARGANVTDLVVLVVAADDGVMPTTIESINHAKAAGVPVVVALNKIDLPQVTEENIQKIYGQLAEHGLNPVEWGGETEVIKTSAETGQGIQDLMEILDYQAELLELTADYAGAARGTVIETEMQPGRGSVARVLVDDGQIKVGDFIVIGRAFGRVRDMTDDHGQSIQQAGPATPLELSGIDMVPDAGDKFYVTATLRKAEEIALQYRDTERQDTLAQKSKVTLDNFSQTIKAGQIRELRVVLKADVQGSMDVLQETLSELGNEEVAVKVLHAGVGGINERDVLLADASDAIIIGFNVSMVPTVRDEAEARQVEIRLYDVIYDLLDDVKKGLEGLLEPETKEERLGAAEVREVFKVSKIGRIAGCLVTEGSAQRSAKVRVVRDGTTVTQDRSIESLRRVKDDVSEVRIGTECGIRIQGFEDVKPGDVLEFYRTHTIARKLD